MNEKSKVKLKSFELGDDLIIMIYGGNKPHVGAVALAIPYKETASASLINIPGHKDGNLAIKFSEKLAKALKRTVVLALGIHIDNALQKDIEMITKKAETLIDEFIRQKCDI